MSRSLSAAEIITHTLTSYVAESDLAREYVCDGCEWDSTQEDPDRCPTASRFDIPHQCPRADDFIRFTYEIHDAVSRLLGPRATKRYIV